SSARVRARTVFSASTSALLSTAMRTRSAPARSSSSTCRTVASTSCVRVAAMLCTAIGARPPISRSRTRIVRLWRGGIMVASTIAYLPGASRSGCRGFRSLPDPVQPRVSVRRRLATVLDALLALSIGAPLSMGVVGLPAEERTGEEAQEHRLIRGRVELQSGLPPGQRVIVLATLHLGEEERHLEIEPAADGSFTFELPGGRLWGELEIAETPFLQNYGTIVFEPGREDIVLRPRGLAVVQGRVHASVLDPDGLGREGVERGIDCGPFGIMPAREQQSPFEIRSSTTLFEDGTFRFERLEAGVPLDIRVWSGRSLAVEEILP